LFKYLHPRPAPAFSHIPYIGPITLAIDGWHEDSFRVRVVPGLAIIDGLPGALDIPPKGARVTKTIQWLPDSVAELENGNLRVVVDQDGLTFTRVHDGAHLALIPMPTFRSNTTNSTDEQVYFSSTVKVYARQYQKIYGLGQVGWTKTNLAPLSGPPPPESTPDVDPAPFPQARNGYIFNLRDSKYHISIPFAVSSIGYGFALNMPGFGSVAVSATGGTTWQQTTCKQVDFWMTTTRNSTSGRLAGIYDHYSSAFGRAPLIPESVGLFWQSRKRYRTSTEILAIAKRYKELDVPTGMFVVDNDNQYEGLEGGSFKPSPICFQGGGHKQASYPPLATFVDELKKISGAEVMFSVWPIISGGTPAYAPLKSRGCLGGPFLFGGILKLGEVYSGVSSWAECNNFTQEEYIIPNYVDQGVTSWFLDEADTAGITPATGYTQECGSPEFCTRTWINGWASLYSKPVLARGGTPTLLIRSAWLGTVRHGIVLWSSDSQCTFEELAASPSIGLSAALSGVPWWTTDVGGFGSTKGCDLNNTHPTYQELIVRWFQFGALSPIFRTHGCRVGSPAPLYSDDVSEKCKFGLGIEDPGNGYPSLLFGSKYKGSCAEDEVWAYDSAPFLKKYGQNVSDMLIKYVRLRRSLLPYIMELASNVTERGELVMRPIWYEFPEDVLASEANNPYDKDTYMFGPRYLVAPVLTQHATSRVVHFPKGARWRSYWNNSEEHDGGADDVFDAPLDFLPLYERI
jgi:alpha-D-xyloside xylohydrolase